MPQITLSEDLFLTEQILPDIQPSRLLARFRLVTRASPQQLPSVSDAAYQVRTTDDPHSDFLFLAKVHGRRAEARSGSSEYTIHQPHYNIVRKARLGGPLTTPVDHTTTQHTHEPSPRQQSGNPWSNWHVSTRRSSCRGTKQTTRPNSCVCMGTTKP
ncbi:unnamed protein product [Ectocarpus sp. 12 AP-2014]